ncbi:MAG: 50S ribosomal protein L23 [Planctomycetes bacterium]|jgi:large subunit ribosomal protein L23|nr:50S ribosomal protein L23 [Planctomycetota bacterium]
MSKIDAFQVIKRPLITEQGMHLVETQQTYPFAVDLRANKLQIRKAVEELFKVKVDSVRTANRHGKKRRRGRVIGRTEDWKKAYVKLKEGHSIELF